MYIYICIRCCIGIVVLGLRRGVEPKSFLVETSKSLSFQQPYTQNPKLCTPNGLGFRGTLNPKP